MTKIPVGKTIAHAYGFAFRRLPAIAAVMWASWVLLMMAMFLSRGSMAAFSQASATRDFSLMQGQWGPLLLFYIVAFILVFVQMTGLTRLALDLPMPSRYFYFSLGRPVWRMIGAVMLTFLAIIALVVVYALAIFLLGILVRLGLNAHPSGAGKAIATLLTVCALLIAYCGFIFLAVRFFFLLGPIVVMEERISIARQWSLTQGNFWRIFLIMLVILLPVVAIELGGMLAIAGFPPLLPHGASPEELLAFRQAQQAWQLGYAVKAQQYWYLFYPVAALFTAVFYGLGCSAQAFAYRALSESKSSDPVALD